MTVARSDAREAVVDIPDQLTGDLADGTGFDVILQSLPAIRTEAKLREIAPQADSSTRTRRVRLALLNAPSAFRLGSTVTATRVMPIEPTIELPLSALLEKDGKQQVWIVDAQSKVALHDIQIGAKRGGSFVVTGGLNAGARVVTAGVHSLTPGETVKIPEGAAK